ncbi:MAG: hypothetical protein RL659_1100 [Pseudomonadota bacterium]
MASLALTGFTFTKRLSLGVPRLWQTRLGEFWICGNNVNHLIGEMLQKATDIQLQHIPYKAAAAAATDVVGGQVPLSVQSMPSSIAFIRAGKLKVLGVVNEKRLAALPDAPTIGETVPVWLMWPRP